MMHDDERTWAELEEIAAEEADRALDRRQEEALEKPRRCATPGCEKPVRAGMSMRDAVRAAGAVQRMGVSVKDLGKGPRVDSRRSIEQWERDCAISLVQHQARRKMSPHPFPGDIAEAVVIGLLAVLVLVVGYLFLFGVWAA